MGIKFYKFASTDPYWVVEITTQHLPEITAYIAKKLTSHSNSKISSILWHDHDVHKFSELFRMVLEILPLYASEGYYMREDCTFLKRTNDLRLIEITDSEDYINNDTQIVEYDAEKQPSRENIVEIMFGILNKKIGASYSFNKPRYIRWITGKHWYVKVGNQDVVVDGRQKWPTKDEAIAAYNKWKKQRRYNNG